MIDTRILTLVQLGIVALGALVLWRLPRFARTIVVFTVLICYAATALAEPDDWRAYVDPALFLAALIFVFWVWDRVRDARRRGRS